MNSRLLIKISSQSNERVSKETAKIQQRVSKETAKRQQRDSRVRKERAKRQQRVSKETAESAKIQKSFMCNPLILDVAKLYVYYMPVCQGKFCLAES